MGAPLALAALVISLSATAALAGPCATPAADRPSVAQLAACKADMAETEADLAKAYRQLRARTPLERRTQLAKAQQSWLAYRAAQCAFEGRGASPTILGCTAAMNRDRIARIDEDLARED